MTEAKTTNSEGALVAALGGVLADTYVLAVKTHGYHWNVTGPLFAPLHDFFGKQYEALFLAADEIAERIRALGAMAPSSMAQLLARATIKEASGEKLDATAMIADLLVSHEAANAGIDKAIELADNFDDDGTEDLLIQRRKEHDKTIWMLQSMVKG